MNFKTQFSDVLDRPQEIFTQPSQTIPEQSMSIHEIMRRYAQGLPMSGVRVPTYNDDEQTSLDDIMPNLKKLDLVDIQELKKYADTEVKKLTKKAEKEAKEYQIKAATEAKQQKEILFEEFQKKLSDKQSQKQQNKIPPIEL